MLNAEDTGLNKTQSLMGLGTETDTHMHTPKNDGNKIIKLEWGVLAGAGGQEEKPRRDQALRTVRGAWEGRTEVKTKAGMLRGEAAWETAHSTSFPSPPPHEVQVRGCSTRNMHTFQEGSLCTWTWTGVPETEPRGLSL